MEIPEHLELDVSGMAIGDTLRLADLPRDRGRDVPRRSRGDRARDGDAADARGRAGARGGSTRARSCPRARCRRAKLRRVPPRASRRRRRRARHRRGVVRAAMRLVASGRSRLVARPARRRARQSGPRVRRTTGTTSGWMVVDELARRHDGSWKGKFYGQLSEMRLDGHRVALLKPETYMNESGDRSRPPRASSRSSPTRSSSCTTRSTSSPAASRRAVAAGSPATTGCARSRTHLGTQDFLRLRIGVGRPGRGDPRPPADYVLSAFEPEDDAEAIVARAADAVETLDAEGSSRRSRASTRRLRPSSLRLSGESLIRDTLGADTVRTAYPE